MGWRKSTLLAFTTSYNQFCEKKFVGYSWQEQRWCHQQTILTCCERLDKYDLSHYSAVPVIPKDISSRRIMMSWSRVSKAELKSERTNSVTCCRFVLWKISLTALKRAVSLLCCFLYAFYILIQDTSHCLAIVHVTGQIQLFLLLWKQIGLLNCLSKSHHFCSKSHYSCFA